MKVDNLYHEAIPPTVKTDYNFYGGINRDVWLRITEPQYVSEVHWATPKVDQQQATLEVHTQLSNAAAGGARQLSLLQEVLDPAQKVVASLAKDVSVGPAPWLSWT